METSGVHSTRANTPGGYFIKGYSSLIIYTLLTTLSMAARSWSSLVFIFMFLSWTHIQNFDSIVNNLLKLSFYENLEKIIRCLPFRAASRRIGNFFDWNIPVEWRSFCITLFIKVCHVDLHEAVEQDLTKYKSISEFFRRAIKSELRPIHPKAEVVSPVDGLVVYHQAVEEDFIRRIKGFNFKLKDFFMQKVWPDNSVLSSRGNILRDPVHNDLFACVIYLAPGNYHRFHSPVEWKVTSRRHVSGELLSVNPNLSKYLPNLFTFNERVILRGEWQHGFFSMTPVGGTNVGTINIFNDEELSTNLPTQVMGTCYDRSFNDDEFTLQKGDLVGEFKLGSTVALIYEAPKSTELKFDVGETIRYGEAVAFTD